MGKLFTKHDPLHFHKILGLICLLHFIYRFGLFALTGSMGFERQNVVFVVGCMACHMALSGSALVFKLPKSRVKTDRPMIWPEFRAHNILFAYRPIIAIMAFKILAVLGLKQWQAVAGTILIFTTLVCSDLVSKHFQSKDRTMRGMPYPEGTSTADMARIKRFHAIAQFQATISTMVGMEFAFMTLMPVQISAFLMTLVRKGLIGPRQWHLLYAFTLVLPYIMMSRVFSANIALLPFYTITSFGSRTRLKYNINKFIIWGSILAVSWVYMYFMQPFSFAPNTPFAAFVSSVVMAGYFVFLAFDFKDFWDSLQGMPKYATTQEKQQVLEQKEIATTTRRTLSSRKPSSSLNELSRRK
mmetsp:Transcript_16030/g.34708  ORF Transcript_16030/g.34708 Transcript_16030/m.34708 type:complete len:356 (-) Transcript_16030:1586-2653(-)